MVLAVLTSFFLDGGSHTKLGTCSYYEVYIKTGYGGGVEPSLGVVTHHGVSSVDGGRGEQQVTGGLSVYSSAPKLDKNGTCPYLSMFEYELSSYFSTSL
jgi:hypothetical protein